MSAFFNLDNPVWSFIGKLADVFWLHILWIICCIPIVTAGASTTALYYVTMKLVKNEEGYITKGFFKSFKENFKQATVIWLLMLVVAFIFAVDYFFYLRQFTFGSNIVYMIFLGLAILYLLLLTYVFPVLAKFYNPIPRTMLNAFFISVRHLPWSILLIVMDAAIIYLSLTYVPVLLLGGFALIAFLNSFIFVKIFKVYIPEESRDAYEILSELKEEDEKAER